jgi:hypothetical protein
LIGAKEQKESKASKNQISSNWGILICYSCHGPESDSEHQARNEFAYGGYNCHRESYEE